MISLVQVTCKMSHYDYIYVKLFAARIVVESSPLYSSPSQIRLPYLLKNCGHIRKVAFGEREK